MVDELIKEIYSKDRDRRVEIIRRDTGTYFYQQCYFSGDPFEMCWIPLRQRSIGLFESAERAESEARSNIDWLVDESRKL